MKQESGFTLVELAIVLIIVGLLIGGILKGQELIAGARVASTVSEIKSIDVALLTFLDIYQTVPAEVTNPDQRLPNCTAAPCNAAPGGNNLINSSSGPDGDMQATRENVVAFAQLRAANLFDGVDGSGTIAVGQAVPASKMGRGTHYRIGWSTGGGNNMTAARLAANVRPGHYLSLTGIAPGTAITATGPENNGGVTPSEAGRIDQKYDDGMANGGQVISANTTAQTATTGCSAGATSTDGYNTQNSQTDCSLYIRVME